MIADAVIGLATFVLTGMLGLLPDAQAIDWSGLQELFTDAAAMDRYFPMHEVLTVLSIGVALSLARSALWLVGWVYSKIPGKFT